MFDSYNDAAGAQGTFILPMAPDPDVLGLSQGDRQMVQGVYPGILADVPDLESTLWIYYHHHYTED